MSRTDQPSIPPRTRGWLIAIAVFAFVLRLVFVLNAGERALEDDETGYDNIAYHVTTGQGYQVGTDTGPHPTAARGPSYVFYVAGFYQVFGRHSVPPLIGQCALDALSCLLAFWIAWRLFRSRRGALFAALLYAIYPPFVFNATQLITETLTNFFFLGGVAFFLEYLASRRAVFLVLSAVFVGLGALIKPPMAPIAALLMLVAIPVLGWGKAIRAAVVAGMITLAVMAPWIIRNAIVFHEFIPGVTLVGYTFWGGTAPVGGVRQIGSMADPAIPDSVRAQLSTVNGELEQSHWFMQEGMRVIKSDPVRYAKLCVRKIPQLWLNLGFDEPSSPRSYAVAAFNLVAFGLAIFALRVAHPIPPAALMLGVLWVFWTLANLPAPVVIRYAMPYYAVLLCYVGAGASELARRLGWKDPATSPQRENTVNFEPDETQKELCDAVRGFGATLNEGMIERDAAAEFDREVWRRCAEFGIQGLPVPAEYGGTGHGLLDTILAMEALGYGCADNGLMFSLNAQMWSFELPLVHYGTEEQKQRYLPRVCRGEIIGAHAVTEPDHGSDAMSMKSRYRRDGNEYVLNGSKTFVTNGPVCDVVIAFATLDPKFRAAGITAFLIDRDTPGVSLSKPISKMGLRTSPMGEVTFEDCRIPVGNRLGGEGTGFAVFNSAMEWERACIFASHLGSMQRVLDKTIEYAKTREQFGQPISQFSPVADKIVDMKVTIEASRLLLYRVGAIKDSGGNAVLEAAMAKLFISEAHVRQSLEAIQIHGGYGYSTEYEIERELRDAIPGKIYSGTSEIQRKVIARLLGL